MSAIAPARRIRTRDGAVLHVEGPSTEHPVLMIQGLGYAAWAAAPLRDPLWPGLGVWSVDNRGTGMSGRGTLPISIELLAEDAALTLEHVHRPVPVIGHSMGGYVAQWLAVKRPELVAALVLIGTSGGGASATPVPESTRRAWLDAAGLSPAGYARSTMPISFSDGWPSAHATAYERILSERLAHPTPADVWRQQYAACERFLLDGYDHAALSAPTLILHGTADRVVPVQNGRALSRLLSDVRYRELDGAGHLLHLERPNVVGQEILQFLTTINHDTKE